MYQIFFDHCSLPDTVVGAGNRPVDKTEKPLPCGACSQVCCVGMWHSIQNTGYRILSSDKKILVFSVPHTCNSFHPQIRKKSLHGSEVICPRCPTPGSPKASALMEPGGICVVPNDCTSRAMSLSSVLLASLVQSEGRFLPPVKNVLMRRA